MRSRVIITIVLGMMIMSTGFAYSLSSNNATTQQKASYTMPQEDSEHEGTWLQWPHNFTYSEDHKESLQSIWIQMTKALATGEMVHIIAYNEEERVQIEMALNEADVDLSAVDFYIYPTDDVWVRDNGPVFVYDNNYRTVMLNWGFNGWGKKTPYKKCAEIPKCLSKDLEIPIVDLKKVVLEGGAVEFDGSGTCITTRSSVTNKNRNPKLSEKKIEEYIKKYYGVKQVIWLDGISGEDITDFHIDGFVKFLNRTTVVTMQDRDLEEWGLSDLDIERLHAIKNTSKVQYKRIYLPLTKIDVVLKNGKKLGYKGSYVNYYIANNVILVPNYNDPNDVKANAIIQKLYPTRKVVGIDVRELYKDGGMIHCVTQQQPIDKVIN